MHAGLCSSSSCLCPCSPGIACTPARLVPCRVEELQGLLAHTAQQAHQAQQAAEHAASAVAPAAGAEAPPQGEPQQLSAALQAAEARAAAAEAAARDAAETADVSGSCGPRRAPALGGFFWCLPCCFQSGLA